MLDDFKTELKRLGIKRIKKDEDRRQSYAVVLDDKDTDEHGELEFADALNSSPERFADERRGRRGTTAGCPDDAMGHGGRRLRHDSILEGGSSEGRFQTEYGRDRTGQGGRRISQLPALGIKKGWNALAARKVKKQIARGNYVVDIEKDAPDVVRSDSRQDPRTDARHYSYPEIDEEDDDDDSDDSGNSDMSSEIAPRTKKSPGKKLDRLTGETFANSDGTSSTLRPNERRHSSNSGRPPDSTDGPMKEKGKMPWEYDDDEVDTMGGGGGGASQPPGELDFQTKPPGF